jgi:AI-2 transport protein TqsA
MPDWLASLIGMAAIVGAMLMVFSIIAGQIDAVIAAGPAYVARGQELVTSVFAWLGEDVAAAIVAAFEDIDLAAYVRALAGSAGYSLATAILIVLYVGFLFAERAHFTSKLANLFPDADKAERVERHLPLDHRKRAPLHPDQDRRQRPDGLLVYVVLEFFGLEFAETWAILRCS